MNCNEHPIDQKSDRITDPHLLIRKEDVEKVLKTDKGDTTELLSFQIKAFTQKGDNYSAVVTSIVVKYKTENEPATVTYVAKINPCKSEELDTMNQLVFKKECSFYSEILPLLNSELERVGEANLRIPRCFHCITTKGKEVIYLENLRQNGFKMVDRKKGMDAEHTHMILKEVARLHGASILLMSRAEYHGVDMVDKHPGLEEMFAMTFPNNTTFPDYMNTYLETAAKISDCCEGYEKVASYLRSLKGSSAISFDEVMKVTPQFSVICHGDCWNNNFLFR